MNYFKQYSIPAFISVIITMLVLVIGYYKMPIGFLEPKNDTVGASITTINGSDTISSSRSVINSNFANLNSSKLETTATSVPTITTLAGLTTASLLNTIGTIVSGIWHGSTITVPYGGTGSTSFNSKEILMGSSTNQITTVPTGSSGQVLSLNASGTPTWSTQVVNTTIAYDWTGPHSFASTTVFNAPVTISSYPTASTSPVIKGYADINYNGKYATTTGQTVQYSDATEYSQAAGSVTKTFRVLIPGDITITYDRKVGGGVGNWTGNITFTSFSSAPVVNTSAAGGAVSTSYASSSATFYATPGKYLLSQGTDNTLDTYIKNFKISFSPLNISSTYAY